jgi:C6 transcription factor Pro1
VFRAPADSSFIGCFTCRLRRKKCDEGKPACKACKHLGLKCEYKRPMWWSNNEQRRYQKESIKNIIKRTKLTEKAASQVTPMVTTVPTPPSLCHSIPTSDNFSDGMERTRGGSMDSQYSLDFNQMSGADMFGAGMMLPPQGPYAPYQQFAPYEVDIKTERQMFVDGLPTRRDSTISTFSTFQAPPSSGNTIQPEGWIQQDYFEQRHESIEFTEEPLDFNFFDFQHGQLSPAHQSMIQVDECDQHLLNHFVENVLRLIFPVLDVNQHGSARSDAILPALEANKTYLHCCLSISALHLKSTQGIQSEQIDNDIMRHKFATINGLCEALNLDTDHAKILEATLGLIFFQCSVGRPDDCLPDIPWHSHFQAATSLINKLELPMQLVNNTQAHPPFNMTVAAWIDILGATMLGRAPSFADTYREKNVANSPAGLAELMGCEDRIMFLISEIACLEALKLEGMDTVQLCNHVRMLGEHISLTETSPGVVGNAYSATGAIRPKQLSKNITAIFRIAARIYLCSLLPDFDPNAHHITNLVTSLAEHMNYIPAGPDGFDRSLVWPLLIGGSASLPSSCFRTTFGERMAQMGDVAEFGSFGRLKELLTATWAINDENTNRGERQSVHWRDVMRQQGWDWLII